jgi:transducin (beta)-like 1
VKIWDASTGKLLRDLTKHKQAVYTLSFSPDGRYLVTGGYDCRVIVWNVKDGTVARHYKGGSGIFEVAWNSRGDRVAATFAQNQVGVFDFRM